MTKSKTFSMFFKVTWKAHKPIFFIMLANAIFNSAVTLFNIYSLKIVLDTVVSKTYGVALIYAGIIVAIDVAAAFTKKLFSRIISTHQKITERRINELTAAKLMNAPYAFLEDPYYLDLKERAQFANENQGAIIEFLRFSGTILSDLITLVSLVSLLATFDLWVVLVLFVAVLLTILINLLSMRFVTKFFQQLLPINRRYGYYINALMDKQKGKEYRLNANIREMVFAKFAHFNGKTMAELKRFSRVNALISGAHGIVNYIQIGIIYLLVVLKTIRNHLSIGSFSLYASGAISFSTAASSLISQVIYMFQYIEYLKPWAELMTLPEEKKEGTLKFVGPIRSIEFTHVCFAYPKSKTNVLNDVSFNISGGQKISIVGLNGVGKTTLIKLLCRLYHQTSGKILVNGQDIFDYEYDEYMSKVVSVFQDYKLFAFTLEENITGDLGHHEHADEIIKELGLKTKIDALPFGLRSRFSKEYDLQGIELSGGESQKIAIGRAISKESSLIILDEPTSALDPIAEAEIYSNFNNLAGGKTAIFISHRLSSSVFCDKVLLLDDGKVVDFDTHAKLMEKTESLYYRMFTTQAKNYKIEHYSE